MIENFIEKPEGKPVKKSKFMQRLEEAQKMQEQQILQRDSSSLLTRQVLSVFMSTQIMIEIQLMILLYQVLSFSLKTFMA